MKKKSKLQLVLLALALLILTACGTSEVTASSPDLWERFVYFFFKAVTIRLFLSLNAYTIDYPLHFNYPTRNSQPVPTVDQCFRAKCREAHSSHTHNTYTSQKAKNELQANIQGVHIWSRNRLAQETQKRPYKELE